MAATLQSQLMADLQRRAALLPQEIAAWQTLTQTNKDGQGIHRSQVAAINIMFDELLNIQRSALTAVNAEASPDTFAVQRWAVENELTKTHALLAIFRIILAQRRESDFHQQVLDAADLIAAQCYNDWLVQVVGWGVLTDDQRRAPPLTFLNASPSPAAYTRRLAFKSFKLPLPTDFNPKLPIAAISLPFHHIVSLWQFCTLYHEVGHPLDYDLWLFEHLDQPLRETLTAQAAEGTPTKETRVNMWRQWLREVIADTVAVLLGGGEYAYALANLLYLRAVDATYLNPQDTHPNHYVRIFLIGALLRQTGVPALAQAADDVEQRWQTLYGQPENLMAYVQDCPIVARVLLDQPLQDPIATPPLRTDPVVNLCGHRLREFGARLADDQALIASLARYLRIQFQRPNPKTYPYRLVPAAAQMAMRQVTDKYDEAYAAIQDRALQFIQAIDRPQYLAAPDVSRQREAYWRSLVQAAHWDDLIDDGDDGE